MENLAAFLGTGLHASASERYRPVRLLGRGAYGEVWAVEDLVTHERLAIKKVSKVFENPTDARRTLREVKLLQHLDHKNVVRIKEILRPPSLEEFRDVCVVYELMETDLHQILQSPQVLSEGHCQWFMEQLLKGLKYIHSANILHRDIKPTNLLVNSACDLKICDFNLARAGATTPDLTEYVVTRHYRAPELLLTCHHYTPAVDVWSAGCIFAELMRRQVLFKGADYVQQLDLITQVLGTPSEEDIGFIASARARRYLLSLPHRPRVPLARLLPPGTDPLAIDLLEKMLVFDPAKRITVEAALRHPYFADGDDPEAAAAAAAEGRDEDVCPAHFALDCDSEELTVEAMRQVLYEEALEGDYRRSLASSATYTDEEQYLD